MGIFSFLSGKGGEGAASEQAPDGARDAGATVTEAAPAQAGTGVDAETVYDLVVDALYGRRDGNQ